MMKRLLKNYGLLMPKDNYVSNNTLMSLILTFLHYQKHQLALSENNLGKLFVKLIRFYSMQFNYKTHSIQGHTNLERLFKIQALEIETRHLQIIDFKGRNITKNFTRSDELFEMFKDLNN